MAPETPKKAEPTPQEAFLFLYILKHLKNKPDVDWDAVAQDAGFKNGQTANARFRQIKQKLGFSAAGSPRKEAATGDKTPKSRIRKSVTPRKGRKAVGEENQGEDEREDLHGTKSETTEVQGGQQAEVRFKKAKSEADDDQEVNVNQMFKPINIKAEEDTEDASTGTY